MPGTIQVSILELVGIPYARSSSMGIKVTVGKLAHEGQDGGDFSFPLASFRDNLNVSIRDLEGNEIAHTAVETRSIVEKGVWDDLFALKGGGHVHMRLQFVLTEDELKRIRSMRESASRKKQEDLLKRRHSSADLANASGGSSASSQDSLKTTYRAEKQYANPAPNQVSKISGSDANTLSKGHPSQRRQSTPAFSTSKSTGALDKLVANRPIKEVIQPQDQVKQSPLDKTPSNVRKMVLAFETNPVKELSSASSKTRLVPQISTTATVDAPARPPSLKRTIGANAKPAPIPEGTGTEKEENKDCEPSICEEQVVEKPEQLRDLKPQNIDYTSSKKDMLKTQPIIEELKEDDLDVQNIDYMSSKKDIPKIQPIREEQKEEKHGLKLQNVNYMSNEKDIPKMPPTREEQKEEKKDLKSEKYNYMSSKNDGSKMQSTREEQTEEKKDITEMQPTKEEQKEEKKDLKLQNVDYLSSKKDTPKMQPSVEEQKEKKYLKLQNVDYLSSKKDTPKMQPSVEEQKEKKDLKLQNIDYLSSMKDTPKMQPSVEEQKEKKDLKLQNVDYLSSMKDTPKMQPSVEEQKEKKDLKPQNIDYMLSKQHLPKMQPIREVVKEEKKGLELQNIDYMLSKTDIPKMQPTREEQKEEIKSPKNLSSTAESSRLSLHGLVRAFPSRKQSAADISTELQGALFHEPFVIEKNWRSKHWKSLRQKVKSNTIYLNVNCASDRLHEWIFLDEMICSCIPSDERPFIDLLEGWLSNCSSETNQGKLTDTDLATNRDEKSSRQRKNLDSGSSSKNGNSRRPVGQAMKIALMVGFGLLVFLTRQRR